MIYGDNPVIWNEHNTDKKDQLYLNYYTNRSNIVSIMQSGNLYGYALNNPLLYMGPTGESVSSYLLEWTSTGWTLTLVDGPFPVGDAIYVGGIIILNAIDSPMLISDVDLV